MRHKSLIYGLLGLFACASGAWGAESASPGTPRRSVEELAVRIDFFIDEGLKAHGAKAVELADDATFLRRVYLDIAGRIPSVAEVRAFLDDPSPNKRRELVDRLLDGPYYVRHFSAVWRSQILPAGANTQFQFVNPTFENWLQNKLRDNVPYDQMVRELLTVSVNPNAVPGRVEAMQAAYFAFAPLAFYQANEMKPENLAASVSRMFLGVKLECAQCHDHPFAPWKRQQFWEFAAFFAGIRPQNANNGFIAAPESPDRRELTIPGTDKTARARFLDGSEPRWAKGVSTRAILADWLVAPDNPFFARTAANRLWAHFFGIGLIDPVDEPGDDNPPSHPELLDELAQQLVLHNFDLKYLIRAITASKTYQRSSTTVGAPENPRLFGRMLLKGLTPEQLYDSLVQATGVREGGSYERIVAFNTAGGRADFLNKFASLDKPTETETSILQALTLMNGRFIAEATDLNRSELLAAVLDAPFLDTPSKRIETLFLATLSRKPRDEELTRLVRYVEEGGPKGDARAALADIFWALLNSPEFRLNH
ncbi:MAG: DUF1549 and DUF1553 domain-containing protein [Gemmataceae bacterium]|nr:DUF1549 and DUF1553 domain-containing protein [Gemmataceae bacterium]MDW8265991.1 DUF1549 and DUF1553 domain-containing protein [Gemmataceae bacterium]